MLKNMGSTDRVVRVLVGVALLIAAFTADFAATGWLHWAMIVVGLILAGTAVVGSCPAYTIFGIRTCQK